jgi:transcriptional regulator with XRE-family HTH domain
VNQESYRKKLLGPTYKAVLPPAWDTATWQARPMPLAQRITQLRLWRGLSMQTACDRVGISRQAWDKWERGACRPKPEHLPKGGLAVVMMSDSGHVVLDEDAETELRNFLTRRQSRAIRLARKARAASIAQAMAVKTCENPPGQAGL